MDSHTLHPDASPIEAFSQCHAGILAGLRVLAGLPEMVAAAERARRVAAETVSMFDHAVLDHHSDEEVELFPAVLKSAAPGEEYERAATMVERLVLEHREIEMLWKKIKPSLRSAAVGKPGEVSARDVADLVRLYSAHAAFEESRFLPLAHDVLGRNGNHMAALGLSLHLRRAPQVMGYI